MKLHIPQLKETYLLQDLEQIHDTLLCATAQIENAFSAAFYAQCIESTYADGYETFLLDHSISNCFQENRAQCNAFVLERFYKLAAIHHTIQVVQRRKKELCWEDMANDMQKIFTFHENERHMADILYQCACISRSRFRALFARTTARYLFAQTELSPVTLAFLMNFWYNSYQSFMASFINYVPFRVRLHTHAII